MEDPSPPPSEDDSDPNPEINQDVNGDRNQVFGQVLGSIIIYYAVTNNYYAVDANSSTRKITDPQIGANPYQGISAFQETDGDRFFGRNAEVEDLWNKFFSLYQDGSATRLLTIYGPSGSGKSSLVRAGLIPKLAIKPLSVRECTRVVVMLPGTRPLEALGLVLARIAITNDPSPVEKGAEFKRVLEKNKDGRYEGLCQIANALLKIESQPLIVVVDQLEELFTLCKDPVEREAFIGNLLYATADQSKRVAAIVTLSSDFLGKAPQYSFNKLTVKNSLLVMAMDEEGLRQAIVKPAKLAWNLTNSKWYKPEVERDLIDAGTVNLLIEQTRGREGILPLLQFALQQIWVGLQAGETPASTLDAIGGVAGALAGKAQRIYDSLEPEEQKIARQVFLGLVQLGEGVKDTRRRTELSRLISYQDNPKQVRKVIGLFAHPEERLITLSNNGREDNKREETAEVTHEALFENWQQLKDWLETSRSDLPLKRRLEEAAVIWDDHGRQGGNLWRSPNLDLLREFQERAGDEMNSLQRDFFLASIDAEEAQKQAEEKAAKDKKRQRQVLTGVMSTGLVLTSGAAIFALYQVQQVQRQRVAQLAITAEALLVTKPVEAQINAIAAVDLAQSMFVSFPKYSMPSTIRHSLFETLRLTREQNRLLENNSVRSVAFSPDGKTIISGCSDHKLRRWNAETGQLLGQPGTDHKEEIRSVAFSRDGTRIVSGSLDTIVKIWDASNGKLLKSLNGHHKVVSSVAFNHDGSRIVSGSGDNTIRIWDIHTSKSLTILTDHKNVVNSVAFNHDGTRIASGSSDNTIRIWDANTGKPITQPLTGHDNAIFAVAFSRDGTRIVSGSLDNTIRIWNANTGKPITQPLTGHNDAVTSVAFNHDGSRIVSGSYDNTIRIWDAKIGESIGQPLAGHTDAVNSVAFNHDGSRIVSGSRDKTVRIWNANTPFVGHKSLVFSVAFNHDGTQIASSSRDKTVRIWDRQGDPKNKLTGHTDAVYAVAFSPDSKMMVSGGWHNELLLWDIKTDRPIGKKLTGHNNAVSSVAFSPNGERFVSGSYDNTVKIWDTNTGKFLKTSTNHRDIVLAVAFSPDSQMVVSGSQDNTARIWNARTGKHIFSLSGHQGAVRSVIFSPDSQMIVSGGEDKIVRIWNASTGKRIFSLNGHQDLISAVAFSPNSQMIVSSSRDKTIRLWNAITGKPIGEPLTDNTNTITSVAFSPDGKQIISSGDNTLRVWDITWTDSLVSLLRATCQQLQNHSTIAQPKTNVARDANHRCKPSWEKKRDNQPS
jgi:WD40 repeat protein